MKSLLRRGFFVCPQMYKILKFSKFWLKKAIIGLVILILALNMPTKEANAAWNYEDIAAFVNDGVVNKQDLLMIVGGSALMGVNQTVAPKTIQVIITGYSSTPDQTDSTPFITASNLRKWSFWNNFLQNYNKIPRLGGGLLACPIPIYK